MVVRISAQPDANGVITVSCGDDVIEIHVAPPPKAKGAGGNPFDKPVITLVRPPSAGHVVDEVARHVGGAPGRHRVVIRAPAVDLHQMRELRRRLPAGVDVSVDLSDE